MSDLDLESQEHLIQMNNLLVDFSTRPELEVFTEISVELAFFRDLFAKMNAAGLVSLSEAGVLLCERVRSEISRSRQISVQSHLGQVAKLIESSLKALSKGKVPDSAELGKLEDKIRRAIDLLSNREGTTDGV